MNTWQEHYRSRIVSAREAVFKIGNGQHIFLSGNATLPGALVRELSARQDLEGVELNHLLTFGEDPFIDMPGIRTNAWFLGPATRKAVNSGRADYTPIFLSEIAGLVRSGSWKLHVALINVSPPDRYGFMSFGAEVSVSKPCAEAADMVIAQVNARMPRTQGDSYIHAKDIDFFVLADEPLTECKSPQSTEVDTLIGKHVAALVEDGATLQMGIGGIPDAVLAQLGDRKDLGIHTEMFSDGILPLLEAGVITNQKKGFHRGKIVSSFAMGSQELYSYMDNNPLFEFHPSHYVNDPYIIARNYKMTAVNSAIEVDLTGQVCADSIGHSIYSGIGGQVDFIRGAARSVGGRPIIALASTAKKGTISRIVPTLKPGGAVVTSRGDVHYVVTEYGSTNLFGKNLRQRARALIDIAHPKFREDLEKQAHWLNL